MAEFWQAHVVDLGRELKSLVGRGITLSKSQNALPNLKRVLGVPGDERSTAIQRRLRERLRQEIYKIDTRSQLFDPSTAVAPEDLRLAYECLFHLVTPVELKQERYAGIEDHERRRLYAMHKLGVNYSVRTWRLNETGPELELMLFLAKRLTESSETDDGYITELADMNVIMDEHGVTRHVTIVGRLRATRHGLDHGEFYLHYKPDPRPDVYEIEFIQGIDHVDEEWNETTGTKKVTAYFSPLRIGETLNYIYRLTTNSDMGTRSTVYHAPTTDYEHCRTQVTFSERRLPSRVWSFERLTQFDIPGKPTKAALLDPRPGFTYVKEWPNAPAGFCCGLGWEWEDR